MVAKVTMYGPALYELQVRGSLDKSWIQIMEVETISTVESPDQGAVTLLTATFQDQAALRGFLDQLYGLNLPLLSVRHVAVR